MIIDILIAIISMLAGSGIVFLCMSRKLKTHNAYNEYVANENNKLIDENKNLLYQNQDLKSEHTYLVSQRDNMMNNISDLRIVMENAEKQAQEAADKFYEQHLATATEKLSHSLEVEGGKYQESIKEFEKELDDIKQAGVASLQSFIDESVATRTRLRLELQGLQNTVDAAVAAAKRVEEQKQQVDFYRIKLTEADIKEIEMLRSIIPYLRDKEALNKIIWKVFYEKPTTDLIGRVVGLGTHTGIYKITNIENQMCYIGQAANIGDRWKQHIKRGLGAEPPTRNKLYPAMMEFGPENFTFEVVELCDRASLDEREDYWQDYFKAKEFGYSIK